VDVEPGGDAGEHRERKHVGPAAEDHGPRGGEQQAEDARGSEQRPVPVRREIEREQKRAERPRAERGEPLQPRGRDEQHGQPSRADHASRARELGGHGVTTTTAFATWPLEFTRST
jgi:hypothetical protein